MSRLRRRFDTSRVLFEPLEANADASALRGIQGVAAVTARNGEYELKLHSGAEATSVMRDAAARVVPARVEIARLRLEDMFVDIVRGDGAESEQALREHLQGLTGAAA
jgi:hypothetical protein